jgi:hypothetical protein
VNEIIGNHELELLCSRSSTDQVFCVRQILEKTSDILYTLNIGEECQILEKMSDILYTLDTEEYIRYPVYLRY